MDFFSSCLSTCYDEAELRNVGKDLQITFGMGPQINHEGERLSSEYLYPVAAVLIAIVGCRY